MASINNGINVGGPSRNGGCSPAATGGSNYKVHPWTRRTVSGTGVPVQEAYRKGLKKMELYKKKEILNNFINNSYMSVNKDKEFNPSFVAKDRRPNLQYFKNFKIENNSTSAWSQSLISSNQAYQNQQNKRNEVPVAENRFVLGGTRYNFQF